MSCLNRNNGEFDCNGPLILTPSKSSIAGNFYLTCSSTEENHDCVCSPTRDFNVTTCVPGQRVPNACSGVASSAANPCTITWKGDYTDSVDVLPLPCERVLVSPSCKTRCQQTTNGTVQCIRTIICSASTGPVRTTSGNVCSHLQSNVVTTTTTAKDSGSGSTVLALGVVAGLAVIALVITLVVVFFVYRRHRKRSTPANNDYTDINVREVDNTAYESSVGIPNQYERLENERSNGKNPKSGLYMDLDDTTNAQPNQSPKQNDTTDSIYNSIDEYEPNGDQGYAQTSDLPHRSQDVACPVDIPVTSADYLVPEKQQEENSSQWLTENLNPTENYFVLEKDEDRVPSDLTDNDTDTGVVNVNKADTYFMLEEQTDKQNNENVPTDNYFLLEKENEINTKEGTPNDDTYNILNSDINNEKDEITEEDYSHARGAGISQDRRTRETTVEENCEDYDQLFQKPNNNVVYDADNDYDHMNNDDPLTSL